MASLADGFAPQIPPQGLNRPAARLSLVVLSFHHDERGYSAWLDAHPRGFVFNHFTGRNPAMNVLHRASCSFLRRDVDAGARTTLEKVCGDSRDEVEAEATQLRGGADGWKHCGVCMR